MMVRDYTVPVRGQTAITLRRVSGLIVLEQEGDADTQNSIAIWPENIPLLIAALQAEIQPGAADSA